MTNKKFQQYYFRLRNNEKWLLNREILEKLSNELGIKKEENIDYLIDIAEIFKCDILDLIAVRLLELQ